MSIIEPAAAAVIGSGVCAIFFQFLFRSWLSRIESLPDKLSDINSKLAGIDVKIESIDNVLSTVQEHDRKIASLEAHVQAKAKRDTRSYRETSI